MSQIARNLTDAEEGILTGKRYLMHDRDPLFTGECLNLIADAGVESVKLPPRSPNLNDYAERFVRSLQESCLDRMIFFGRSRCGQPFKTSSLIITANAITKVWRTNSSAQSLAISATPVRFSAASAWLAC